jgi:hypothetical protein
MLEHNENIKEGYIEDYISGQKVPLQKYLNMFILK